MRENKGRLKDAIPLLLFFGVLIVFALFFMINLQFLAETVWHVSDNRGDNYGDILWMSSLRS